MERIRKGTVTLPDLAAAGATQLGAAKLEPCGGEYGPSRNLGSTFGPVPIGSRPACVSSCGVHDLVGNVAETVGDWDELASTCGAWMFGDTSPRFRQRRPCAHRLPLRASKRVSRTRP